MKPYGWVNFVNTKLNTFIITQILLALFLAPIHNRFASLPRKIHTSNVSISVITGLQSRRYWTLKKKDKFIKYISYIYNFSTKIPVIHHKFPQEIIHTYVVRDSNKQPLVYFVWLAVYIYILSALYLIMKHGNNQRLISTFLKDGRKIKVYM